MVQLTYFISVFFRHHCHFEAPFSRSTNWTCNGVETKFLQNSCSTSSNYNHIGGSVSLLPFPGTWFHYLSLCVYIFWFCFVLFMSIFWLFILTFFRYMFLLHIHLCLETWLLLLLHALTPPPPPPRGVSLEFARTSLGGPNRKIDRIVVQLSRSEV